MSVEQVKAALGSAQPFTPEPPRPLARAMPPADPFPVDSLGNVLGAAARAIHDRTQAPMAICAQSVLAASTLAVQGHADVELPTGQSRRCGRRAGTCSTSSVSPNAATTSATADTLHQTLMRSSVNKPHFLKKIPATENPSLPKRSRFWQTRKMENHHLVSSSAGRSTMGSLRFNCRRR